MDYLFFGDAKPVKDTKSASTMTIKQLRSYLTEASIASTGSRVDLLARYGAMLAFCRERDMGDSFLTDITSSWRMALPEEPAWLFQW